MTRICCIANCKPKKEKRIPLFSFPKDEALRNIWIKSCEKFFRKFQRNLKSGLYICGKHFLKSDFRGVISEMLKSDIILPISQRPKLRDNIVPSVFQVDESVIETSEEINGNILEIHNNFEHDELQTDSSNLTESFDTDHAEDIHIEFEANNKNMILADKGYERVSIENIENIAGRNANQTLSFEQLLEKLKCGHQIENWCYLFIEDGIIFYNTSWENEATKVQINKGLVATIKKLDTELNERVILKNLKDLNVYLEKYEKTICQGILGTCTKYHPSCPRFYNEKRKSVSLRYVQCEYCYKERRRIEHNAQRRVNRLINKDEKTKKELPGMRDSVNMLRNKILEEEISILEKEISILEKELEIEMRNIQERYEKISKSDMNAQIIKLPKAQQEQVLACFQSASLRDKRGRHYTVNWIYECILLRIKSRATYEYLLEKNIMPLPTIEILNHYIKNLQSIYGFKEIVLTALQKKIEEEQMPENERRGCLLIDEMKINETINFRRDNLSYVGFTYIGEHTLTNQQYVLGDYALIIMFQSFKGKWIQSIGAFLTKSCANGEVLHKVVIEGILLLEKHGLFVDAVVLNGAAWNRNMWKLFGISYKVTSCEHPLDENRSLFFFSDFSNLIKNMRNFVTSMPEFTTPDGTIKLQHWQALIDIEKSTGFNLKVACKLTQNHIKPKFYQKMNVRLAVEFFSERVAVAMELYSKKTNKLNGSLPTIIFIKRINDLIRAMTSRSATYSLQLFNEEYKIIIDFLDYLNEWEQMAMEKRNDILPNNTLIGLKVSLNNTLELLRFLSERCNYISLMTVRLNQDAFETLFGMIRNACGCNDHSDSLMFIQVYRLLQYVSLAEQKRDSDIQTYEVLEVMIKSSNGNKSENWKKWMTVLDDVVEYGACDENIFANVILCDHDHSVETSEYIQAYLCGFIARKIGNRISCKECIISLKSNNVEWNKLIKSLSKDILIVPSKKLQLLLTEIENVVLKICGTKELVADAFMRIIETLQILKLPLIGCEEHKENITSYIVNYYLLCRFNMIVKKYNEKLNIIREKSRKNKKLANCRYY